MVEDKRNIDFILENYVGGAGRCVGREIHQTLLIIDP
jgi:hypothetical protein